MPESTMPDVLLLTAEIVSAHISNNQVEAATLPALIESVYNSLVTASHAGAKPEPLAPAVPWKKSVFPDFLICLEDGQRRKMLKRHLRTRFGLTPEAYCAKWGLPWDYPMVAPGYARQRSALATSIALSRKSSGKSVTTVLKARRAKGSKG